MAGFIQLIAFGIYNVQIIEGTSVPNTATWTLWAFLTTLNFASYLNMSKDWVKSILPAISSVACISTFLFALYTGKLGALGHFDIITLFLGVLAGLVWYWYKSSTYAQVMLQVAFFISFVPTYLSVLDNPFVESPAPWLMWSFAYIINIVIVRRRWRGQYRDFVNPINHSILHGCVGLLAIPSLRLFF